MALQIVYTWILFVFSTEITEIQTRSSVPVHSPQDMDVIDPGNDSDDGESRNPKMSKWIMMLLMCM